jgi:energy-coupling factor transporter ATP-binding protein EcfA2
MEQKEVKIIGLKVNEQMGILQSCQLKFDPQNNLIAVLGSVGSGKSTLQKSLKLGTLGSNTLKDDKELYGKIDEEVQLLDGDENIFVACKSNEEGALKYTIYTKDHEGKIIKDPVIDGVKATPGAYFKNLQTALTWRIDELTSENPTIQKKILLELYKSQLAKVGVVFDKKSEAYSDSILGKIEYAENKRAEKEFARKQVGGFANQLKPLGIDIDIAETIPKRVDMSENESRKNSLQFKIDNIGDVKNQELKEIKNKADEIVNKLKEKNSELKSANLVIENEFSKKKERYKQNTHTYNGLLTDIETLVDAECFTKEVGLEFLELLEKGFKNEDPISAQMHPLLEIDEDGKIKTSADSWTGDKIIRRMLVELKEKKIEYVELSDKPSGDTSKLESDLELVISQMSIDKETNRRCDMVDSYLEWHEANQDVLDLRDEYAQMLSGINTGVDGLNICVNKEDGKLDIYLTYNGAYDPKYFNNIDLEDRKLSSYSGTQKPMICLLLQNYLLSKKPKALRYLWIDDVPIDKKTKVLLNKMGEELNLTVIVNITGDFTRENLGAGDILIEGGEVFFE